MKNLTTTIKPLLIICISLLLPVTLFAQKGTNVQKLQELSQRFQLKWEQENREAQNFANRNGIPFRFETEEGTFFELQSVKDGIPMYYMTENVNSAATISTSNLHTGGTSGLNLDGDGITIHQWDGGAVLTSHQEYSGRVVMGDGVTSTHYHSTHVAGTMIASGVVANAKGMAPNANLRAFDWNSDESEMASEGANGALFSNHSYGYATGWSWTGSSWVWYGNTSISTQEDYLFGFYDSQARDWDQIAVDAPFYLIVKSAGNDRGDGPTNGPYPQDGPYDCISHSGNAKNILTVGAVNDIPGGYSGPSSVVMSSFSSWGPADDGRIKPDISANGVSLYSSYNTNNSSYASLSGTSMAAPSAAGSLALLQEHFNDLNGSFMTAATLKGLVISTADEAGPDDGPDYMFGWGLMNTEKAALKISEDQTLNTIDELVLNNGGTFTRTVFSDGTEPLKVTICWTDLAGTPTTAQLDPADAMLVNDLDLRITQGSNTYYPWKLDRDNPSNAATNTTENNVDNVEMVFVANPVAGEFTITVDHDGSLSGGSQDFAIIIDGITEGAIDPPVAEFAASQTTIFEGGTINFTDLSTNNPTSWLWEFTGGNPSTSNDKNPAVTYNNSGTFTVKLTATNGAGFDIEEKIDYITVDVVPPVADFSSDVTTVIVGNSVQFSDQSTNNPTSWAWSFTGGTPSSSTDQNPMVTYETIGTYSVSLTATNAGGSNTKTESNYITVIVQPPAPIADFTADITDVTTGNSVQFSDLSTNNPTSWSWSFPGGTPSSSTSQNPLVTYNASGTYDVTLIATNGAGSDTKTVTGYITVTDAPISYCDSHGNATAEWINTVAIGTESHTSGSSGITGYQIFDDPILFNFDAGASLPLTLEPGFSPRNKFEYWMVWIDFNVDGDFLDSGEQVFSVGKKRSTVEGSISIPAGLNVETTMRISMKRDGFPTSCEIFSLGEVVDYKILIGEAVVLPPVANFNADNTSIVEGQTVNFTDLSSNNPINWSWTFPGGTPGSSTAQNPSVVYNTAGTYNVTLSASNSAGSDTELKTAYITVTEAPPSPPVADFIASSTSIVVGNSVDFTDLSTNNPTEWSWTFSGGIPATSTNQNPTVSYNTIGTYDVALTATNADGSDTESKTGYITVVDEITYCNSSSQSNALEWISDVVVGPLSKNSGASLYSDFTGDIAYLVPGGSYNISLTPFYEGKDQREFWRIWIDFNGDGDFEDADETVFAANNKKGAVSGSISIPINASGETRMRVTMKSGSSPGPCEVFTGGEVEDYTVNIDISNTGKSGTISEFSKSTKAIPSIEVYPNPFRDEIKINIKGGEEDTRTFVRIVDITGKTLYREEYRNQNNISIRGLPLALGTYYIIVQSDEFVETKQLIKTKH